MKSERTIFHKHVLAALIGAAVVMAPSVGWAGCKQSDLKGKWLFYKHWAADGSTTTGISRCTLVVDGNGNIAGGKKCVDSFLGTVIMRDGGTLKMKKGCKVGGTTLFADEDLTIQHAQMEKVNKTMFAGIGEDNVGFFFDITVVKK